MGEQSETQDPTGEESKSPLTSLYEGGGQQSLAGEYIGFSIHSEEYGVKTSQVRGVVATPAIRRLPKAPPFVAGVANIRGRIVPLLNAVERLGLSASEEKAQEKLVLVELGNSLYGFMVDSVSPVTYVSAEMIEPVNPIMVRKDARFVTGIAKDGERLIYLLDMDVFISAGLEVDQAERDSYEGFATRISQSLERQSGKQLNRFLSLLIGHEEYGVDISRLSGVIPAKRMKKAEGAPDYVSGVVTVKESIFPVIDLQKRFDLNQVPYAEDSRVVIVDAGGYGYGILANSATAVLNIENEEIKEIAAFASSSSSAHIKGFGMLEEGERLITVLDETQILQGKEVSTLAELDDMNMSQQIWDQIQVKGKETLRFLVFNVSHREFAFSLQDLSAVIWYRKPTMIPKAPLFIKGVVSVEGELVSVLDLRKRLDLTGEEDETGTHIIIVRDGDFAYGVVADSISGILRVSKEDIAPPSKMAAGIEPGFIDGVILIKETDRSIIILDAENIISND